MNKNKSDSVWAIEGGVQLGFERLPNGRVKVTIWEDFGARDERIVAVATIENWRWKRLTEAVKEEPADAPSS